MTLKCSTCQTHKDASEFHVVSTLKRGYTYVCKPCTTMRHRAAYEADPLIHKRRARTRRETQGSLKINLEKVGITVETYETMLAAQGGVCAICKNPPAQTSHINMRLHVDHDHACCPNQKSCGRCVRGLLCNNCNSMLGHGKDNPEVFKAAAKYVSKPRRKGHSK